MLCDVAQAQAQPRAATSALLLEAFVVFSALLTSLYFSITIVTLITLKKQKLGGFALLSPFTTSAYISACLSVWKEAFQSRGLLTDGWVHSCSETALAPWL